MRTSNFAKRLIFVSIYFILLPIVLSAQTKVVMLGTGNPNPDPNHQGPGVAIVVNEQAYDTSACRSYNWFA